MTDASPSRPAGERPFGQFVEVTRAVLFPHEDSFARVVYQSSLLRNGEAAQLEEFMRGRVPLYYRHPEDIARAFAQGTDFLQPIRETLLKLPTVESFRSSHFGEVLAGVFAEEILGLKRLYSKLSLLTAENANAYKMDLVLYDRRSSFEFVFMEVKSSMKSAPDDVPANHHRTCFPALFSSFNKYKKADRTFDLAVIKDRMEDLPEDDAEAIRTALLPYQHTPLRFAGMCVIDRSTYSESEAEVLATRQNEKAFDVDLVCVQDLPLVTDLTYEKLNELRDASV